MQTRAIPRIGVFSKERGVERPCVADEGRKRFSSGLSFLVAYTWSKTLTNAESQFSEFSGFTEHPYNRKAEKSYSINDYPHNLVINYGYDLPFGPGKKFAKAGERPGKVVGGWKFAGIQQYQSGGPSIIFSNALPSGRMRARMGSWPVRMWSLASTRNQQPYCQVLSIPLRTFC